MDLDELAHAAQTDPAAAERLFEQLRRELSGFVGRRFRLQGAEVEDVVQNTLLVVHRKLESFESQGPNSVLRWARVIASYEVKVMVRQHSSAPRALESWDNGAPETGMSSRLFRAQVGSLLRAEARELASYERRAIEHELDDGDLSEFAATEQVTRAAARSIRWRARKRLALRVLERIGLRSLSVSASPSTPTSASR